MTQRTASAEQPDPSQGWHLYGLTVTLGRRPIVDNEYASADLLPPLSQRTRSSPAHQCNSSIGDILFVDRRN